MKINKKSKILIISPHPDDEVIGCGGIIAKAKAAGSKLNVLYVTTGYTRQLVTKSTDHVTRVKEIEKASSYGAYNYSILFKDNPDPYSVVRYHSLIIDSLSLPKD